MATALLVAGRAKKKKATRRRRKLYGAAAAAVARKRGRGKRRASSRKRSRRRGLPSATVPRTRTRQRRARRPSHAARRRRSSPMKRRGTNLINALKHALPVTLGIGAGLLGPAAVTRLALKDKDAGLMGIGANVGLSLGGFLLLKRWKPQAAEAFLAAGLFHAFARALNEYQPELGAQLGLSSYGTVQVPTLLDQQAGMHGLGHRDYPMRGLGHRDYPMRGLGIMERRGQLGIFEDVG